MSLKSLFLDIFGPIEREAETVVADVATEIHATVHSTEKEIEMSLPQEITDVINRIKALISGASNQSTTDAKTISDQAAQIKTLQGQVTDLQQQLSDATGQLTEIETALEALAPAAGQ